MNYFILFFSEAVARGTWAPAYDCKCDKLWVRFSLKEMKYLIFSFPHSGDEAKRGVEYRHSTRYVSIFLRKVGNVIVLMGTAMGS